MTSPIDFQSLFDAGVHSYETGQPEAALVQFQQALALAPQDLQAIAACATLLSELGQPQASYQLLVSQRDLLWNDADGVTNLAVGAEALGLQDEAAAAYTRALALDPNHARALNNLALRHARAGRWEEAIEAMQRCATLAPEEPRFWSNWIDFLNGAKRDAEALSRAQEACERFPQNLDLLIRRFACLAFCGRLDDATAALALLGPNRNQMLDAYLQDAASTLPKPLQKNAITTPDAFEFLCLRAFDALNVCGWRGQDRLVEVLTQTLAHAQASGEIRDWRDTQFYALVLPLSEAVQTGLRVITGNAITYTQKNRPGWTGFRPRAHQNQRLRIGIATQNLADPRYAKALQQQLQLHDHTQFEFFLYAPLPTRGTESNTKLAALGAHVVDIDHLTDAEAVGRIRLDRLDLWMDTTFYTAWCRPELPAWRVAPVQLRHQTWQRVNPPIPCDYAVGDLFTHPDQPDYARFGNIARFAHSCWLATDIDPPTLPDTKQDALQDSRQGSSQAQPAGMDATVVFCAFGHAMQVDPFTFTHWMEILRRTPRATLWLPAYSREAQANLQREAAAAGIDASRLVFKGRGAREDFLAQMEQWDRGERGGQGGTLSLYLDTLRLNANAPLVDALAAGLPAITVAGHNMASRLGGSILHAAGLPQCVLGSAQDYVDTAVRLATNPAELLALRQQLIVNRRTAPLFNPAARVREWEAAWRHMVERNRAGLPPVSFDVKIPV